MMGMLAHGVNWPNLTILILFGLAGALIALGVFLGRQDK